MIGEEKKERGNGCGGKLTCFHPSVQMVRVEIVSRITPSNGEAVLCRVTFSL